MIPLILYFNTSYVVIKRDQIELGEHTQIIDIQTSSSPELIGVEENGQWIYGSSLLIKYYIK